MIKVLPYIYFEDLPRTHALVVESEYVIHVSKVKAVAEMEPSEDGESRAVCLYFSDDTSSPDIIIPTDGQETTNQIIKDLENTVRRDKMKIVNLNFNKEGNHEI